MALKSKTGTTKGAKKGSAKPSSMSSASKPRKSSSSGKPAPKPTQQKTKSVQTKKKPPHMRYTEKELKVPQLNGIRPAGVAKPPNAKKGKTFVDDKESMNTILALVMAEKEGNIESKMMRARQLEEVREARRIEAEKRAESKKAGFEDRKQSLKEKSKKRRNTDSEIGAVEEAPEKSTKKPRKRVSFG